MTPEIKAWASENIVWAGTAETNKSDRKGNKPLGILNHISEGSISSLISWFTSPGNEVSSAHFGVSKTGKVYQFVKIEEMAWHGGLKVDAIPKAKSTLVKQQNKNPNLFLVGIEHEGVWAQSKGELTKPQLEATILLHKYIIEYVKDKWGHTIPVDRDHILGHFEVDPVRKPNCPGERFQFAELINTLQGKGPDPNLPFDDIQNHWANEAIQEAYKLGLVSLGVTPSFNPERPLTRAEGVQMMLNLYHLLKQ